MRAFLSLVILSVLLIGCSAPDLPPSTPTVISSPTFLPPTETSTATQIALNVAPEVKAVLDTQKATYAVNAEGKASIDVASTAEVEQVVLEKVGHTPTNDGLAKDILTGQDKDGVRYIFAENYGWMKDIDLSLATIDSPTEIPWEIAQHQVALNTIFALHYAENPTISPNAVVPHYGIRIYGKNVYLTSQPVNSRIQTAAHGEGSYVTEFTKSTQFFTDLKILATTNPQGQRFYILGNTNSNPTKDNKAQTINLFGWMGGERFNVYKTEYLPAVISKNHAEIGRMIIPPPQIGAIAIPWNPNSWADKANLHDPVALMQNQGELLDLIGQQDPVAQDEIGQIIVAFYGGPGSKDKTSVIIPSIPDNAALIAFLIDFQAWTYPPGQE